MKFTLFKKTRKDSPLDPVSLDLLLGPLLVRPDGQLVSTLDALLGKTVCLFFGASWCPPCQEFTPKLQKAFRHFQKGPMRGKLEIVFVSSDYSEVDMFNHAKRWLCVPYGNKKRDELEERFQVNEIPTLVVLNPDGSMHTADGRQAIQNSGSKALAMWAQATGQTNSPWMSISSSFTESTASSDLSNSRKSLNKIARVVMQNEASSLRLQETTYFVK